MPAMIPYSNIIIITIIITTHHHLSSSSIITIIIINYLVEVHLADGTRLQHVLCSQTHLKQGYRG